MGLAREESPPAGPAPLDVWLNPRDGLEYVFIPPGTLEMGASLGDDLATENEKPPREVQITVGFWLCRTPVTAAAFQDRIWRRPDRARPDLPAVKVDWRQARDHCERIGGRLPTDAEWEYAARAWSKTRYEWGTEMDDACACCPQDRAREQRGNGSKTSLDRVCEIARGTLVAATAHDEPHDGGFALQSRKRRAASRAAGAGTGGRNPEFCLLHRRPMERPISAHLSDTQPFAALAEHPRRPIIASGREDEGGRIERGRG